MSRDKNPTWSINNLIFKARCRGGLPRHAPWGNQHCPVAPQSGCFTMGDKMIGRTMAAAVAIAVSFSPALAQRHRLPSGYKWGRCLLVVDGQTRISGKCSYQIEKGGDFNIQGPRQVFAGIDYPDTHSGAGEMSEDYWAAVYKDGDIWDGYGNSDIRATHGDERWEDLHREGACYIGKDVRVCLWR